MPDTRKHRGAHPEDAKLFGEVQLPALRVAVRDLSWLLTHEYPGRAALKLVGDRYRLSERQRVAVSRAACSDGEKERRAASRVPLEGMGGHDLAVDGFNLIITLEAALSGAVLLCCRDGCTRDIASIHGSYRSVEETEPAIRLLGEFLQPLGPASVRWLLDSPISNSGRLAARLREMAEEHGWNWTVETLFNPDQALINGNAIVASSDSVVLDGAKRWVDLLTPLISTHLRSAWRVDLDSQRSD